MYSRKSLGPRMEPSGTPALTGYSCEELPSKTTQTCLLHTEKRQNKANLKFHKT